MSLFKQSLELAESLQNNSQKNSGNIWDQETEERTIYVGNVKASAKKNKLEKLFLNYGEIETIRYRGIAPESIDMSKKEAIATGKLHKHRPTVIAYIRFKNKESKEKALSASGEVFQGLHLSVDHAIPKKRKGPNTIFIGNLPWEVQDEELWTHFGSCGHISNVRIVRSSETGSSKGFGYVLFKTREAVESALKLNETKIRGRSIRIKRASKKEKIQRAIKKKPKSGVSSLIITKQQKKMTLEFLKKDKPHANKIKEKKRENRRKLKPVKKTLNTFSGTEHNKDSNAKNKKSKSKFELKNRRIAKIFEAKNKSK